MTPFGANFFTALKAKSDDFFPTSMFTYHRSHFSFLERPFVRNNFFPIYNEANILKFDTFSDVTG